MNDQEHGPAGRLAPGGPPGDGAAVPIGVFSVVGGIDATGEAAVVLAQVRWLLQDAADQVRLQAQAGGLSSAGHPLALGAELAACEAANLMAQPPVDDYGPEHVPAGALDTLTAAEVLTRSHQRSPRGATTASASRLNRCGSGG